MLGYIVYIVGWSIFVGVVWHWSRENMKHLTTLEFVVSTLIFYIPITIAIITMTVFNIAGGDCNRD